MQNTMRFSELHCREVINLCDGARMGEVSDLLFDPVCGQITALVVPRAKRHCRAVLQK